MKFACIGSATAETLASCGISADLVPEAYDSEHLADALCREMQGGGAALLLEKHATGDALYDAARGILDDPEKRASMSRAMAELGIPDATERIFRAVMALVKK